jgi:transcriptional regulator with XRE-family HTH domain
MVNTVDKRSATDVDKDVGHRIRARRREVGLSQTKLASAVGVTHHQIQKYEGGQNRVGIGRLTAIASALNVSPEYFLGQRATAEDPRSLLSIFLDLPEALDLMGAFVRLSDATRRRKLIEVAEQLGSPTQP